MNKIVQALKWRFGNLLRPLITKEYKNKLTNKNFSILSSNCIGGYISHDLGLRFNSPTVNLYISTKDFVKFISNIKEYLDNELVFDDSNHSNPYPIGILIDIKIHFVHYKSFLDAKNKWDERKKRINYSNLFIILTDRDGYDDSLLENIKLIKYPLILFTSHIPKYNFEVYLDYYKNKNSIGEIYRYYGFSGKRIYEKYFNIVDWINSNGKISQ
jgi:uncharacterized protein (DUF1919 family)